MTTTAAGGGPSPEAAGPLAGVRVVEVGSLIAGPFAGRMLADFGAEVVKVENPARPDPLRQWGTPDDRGRTCWWAVQSRNKSCVTLDLGADRGRELFLDLVGSADVLLENLRPGSLEALGLAPETLLERNPRLVMARLSGFGQTGPDSARGGYASVAEAVGGLRHLNGYPDMPPPRMGLSLGDSLGALFAVQGILTALYWRDARGGSGQVVDCSLVEACFAMLESVVPEYAATGNVRGPSGTRLDGIAPSNIFRTADGKWMVVAANQDTVFKRLCIAMGRPELVADPRFATHQARGRNQEEIEKTVGEWCAGYDSGELSKLLDECGVPCGPVNSVADIFADPLFRQREMLLSIPGDQGDEVVMPGIVPKLTRSPGQVRWAGPSVPGRHNAAVFGTLLGLADHELADLVREGVI